MKKYVKSQNNEDYKNIEFNEDRAIQGALEIKRAKKRPTSVALDPDTILKLKSLAEKKGIPYQILMRSYILEGIKKEEKESA